MTIARLRVALVNPPFSKLVYGAEQSLKSITPCLGLFYLKAYCQDIADCKVFEGEFNKDIDELISMISEFEPDVLCVTTNTSTYPLCVRLAQTSRARIKVAGGPYSSYRVEEGLRHFDLIFVGDAEVGFRQLLSGVPTPEIPGIAYRDGDGQVRQTPPAPLPPLDDLPFPDHSAMQIGLYQASPHRQLEAPFATMVTTRGCGFQCTFCLSASGGLNNGRYRERSIQNVCAELDILTKQFGVRSIQFWDDTFTMRRERTKAMCAALAKYDIRYVCNTRTDKMDEEVARWLFDSGCRGVFFGVESGDEQILGNNIRKGVRNEQVRNAVAACKEIGLQTTTSFIFGSIDDTAESIRESTLFALELDADFVLFNIYTAHPGTSGYERAQHEGIIDHYTVDTVRYCGEPAGVPTICRNLTREQLHLLKAEAYIQYYSHKDAVAYGPMIETYREEQRLLVAARLG